MVIIETTTFRLINGADEREFLRADHDVQTELFSPLPGFLRRTTARAQDGEWLVAVLWQSEGDAVEAAASDPTAAAFTQFIDSSTMTRRRYTLRD